VEHELDPAAAVGLGGGDVAFDRGDGRSLLGVRRCAGGVGVQRRDRLGERLRVVDPRDSAAAVVAAVLDDRLRAVVERAERIVERRRGEAVIQQIVAIAADLETSVRRLQVPQFA
jgi:hypothetical protein